MESVGAPTPAALGEEGETAEAATAQERSSNYTSVGSCCHRRGAGWYFFLFGFVFLFSIMLRLSRRFFYYVDNWPPCMSVRCFPFVWLSSASRWMRLRSFESGGVCRPSWICRPPVWWIVFVLAHCSRSIGSSLRQVFGATARMLEKSDYQWSSCVHYVECVFLCVIFMHCRVRSKLLHESSPQIPYVFDLCVFCVLWLYSYR